MSHQLFKLRCLLQQGGGNLGLGPSRKFSSLPLPSCIRVLHRLTKCQSNQGLLNGNHGMMSTHMTSSAGARLVSTSCGAGGKGVLASEYRGAVDFCHRSLISLQSKNNTLSYKCLLQIVHLQEDLTSCQLQRSPHPYLGSTTVHIHNN